MKEVKKYLRSIKFEGLPFEGIIELLVSNDLFDSNKHFEKSVKRVLNEIQKEKRTIPHSKFGSCGIDSNANPCGDADEY